MSDWGKAFNTAINWGTSPQTAKPWGNVVLNSPSGETIIGGKEDVQILSELPFIFVDNPLGYDALFLRFQTAEGIRPMDMNFDVYFEGNFLGNILVNNGTNEIFPMFQSGSYYGILNVVVDMVTYSFESNTLNY